MLLVCRFGPHEHGAVENSKYSTTALCPSSATDTTRPATYSRCVQVRQDSPLGMWKTGFTSTFCPAFRVLCLGIGLSTHSLTAVCSHGRAHPRCGGVLHHVRTSHDGTVLPVLTQDLGGEHRPDTAAGVPGTEPVRHTDVRVPDELQSLAVLQVDHANALEPHVHHEVTQQNDGHLGRVLRLPTGHVGRALDDELLRLQPSLTGRDLDFTRGLRVRLYRGHTQPAGYTLTSTQTDHVARNDLANVLVNGLRSTHDTLHFC